MTEGTKTLTLSEFLLARIAEEEERARAAGGIRGLRWKAEPVMADALTGEGWVKVLSYTTVRGVDSAWSAHIMRTSQAADGVVGDHVAAFSPGRVLAESETKRRIVDEHTQDPVPAHWSDRGETYACRVCRSQFAYREVIREGDAPCATLRLLAAIYADHSDYRDEWKP